MKRINQFKIYFLIAALSVFSFSTFGQDAEEILKKSYEKCQSIQNGYYEMSKYMKYGSDQDTIKKDYTCYFKKLNDDTLYTFAFHYQQFLNDTCTNDVLYTGDDLVRTSVKDSSGIIMSKELWSKEIKLIGHNFSFYSPLTYKSSKPLPQDSDYFDNAYTIKFLGEEVINNIECYHIQMNKTNEPDKRLAYLIIRQEYHFWIAKADFIPMQYSTAFDMVMDNDTTYQYEKDVLNKYEFNNLQNESILTLSSIPDYYTITDYVPFKMSDPLSKGTIAPDWNLISLQGENIKLTDLKGQLVLIDFFYMSCGPCIQALPSLRGLHEKYKDKGLTVIGMDPFDKNAEDMKAFLAKHQISYTVFLSGKDVAKEYLVSGYPTMYLIDKNGKILFSQVGYGKDVEKKLEKIIEKKL